jgi:SNF2 family DNA or RNA helicase
MENYLFNFQKIYEKKLNLHKEIKSEDIRLLYGEYKTLYIIDINDVPEDIRRTSSNYRNIKNLPHTEHVDHNVRFYSCYNEYIVYPYINYKNNDEMIADPFFYVRYHNQFIKTDPLKSTLIALLIKQEEDYYITYYFNCKFLENCFKKENNLKQSLLKRIVIYQKKDEMLETTKKDLEYIQKHTWKFNGDDDNYGNNDNNGNDDDNNGNCLKNNVRLFNYQKNDILWMQSIEEDVRNDNNKITYSFSEIYPILELDYVLYHDTILSKSLIDLNDTNRRIYKEETFKYNGGNLISEVGLGKTIISLYHILSNDVEKRQWLCQFVDIDTCCNYFFKRGPRKGSYCINVKDNVDDFYCKDHKNTLFVDKRVLKYKNLDNFQLDDFKTTKGRFTYLKTNATLIVCPNQLCDQWVNEYYDKFKDDKKIIHLVTYDQFINLTLGDFLFADVVVVSYNFLLGTNYNKFANSKSIFDFVNTNFKLIETPNVSYEDAVKNLLNSKIFNALHLFHWNRVFLDEAHEIENMMKTKSLKTTLSMFQSNYKWNITGTPFSNGVKSFINLLSYNTTYYNNLVTGTEIDLHNSSLNTFLYLGLNSNIVIKCKNLFKRNTKESVKDDYNGNIITEFIKKLTFTNQERNIYDSYANGSMNNYDFLIKICCHSELYDNTKHLIKNCKTFDEIQQVLLNYNKDKLDVENAELANVKNGISQLEIELDRLKLQNYDQESFEFISMKQALSNEKRKYTNIVKNIENITRTYNYLKNSIETLKKQSDVLNCPVCLDDIECGQVTITKCGHKFCWDCIHEIYKTNQYNFKCPTCNTKLKGKDIYLVDELGNTNVNVDDLQQLINTIKSTKIGNIIYFLKTSVKENDKIILFSQWDELLHKVGDILSNNKFKIVYCQGSVYQRKRAIDAFKKDPDIKIIMLSSRNAASGINLTVANKIILLEPVYGTQEYRKNIETQAIGRADRIGQNSPIDVYRFIIKDTIEDDIINDIQHDIKNLSLT